MTLASSDCYLAGEYRLETELEFPIYAMTVMVWFGWLIACIMLPTGMWAMVFDFIGAWYKRPRPMTEAEFNREKNELAKKV